MLKYKVFFISFLLVSCGLITNMDNDKAITSDLIGKARTDDLKEVFKCNYVLDFDKYGRQIWKIKSKGQQLVLIFNQKSILEDFTYLGNVTTGTH